MDYTPAIQSSRSRVSVGVNRTDCPLAVLRSHPDYPNALSASLEGAWFSTNPAWPEETVKVILQDLEPPCHTDWKDFPKLTEQKNELSAYIIYVIPGLDKEQVVA
jgi:hypothetical protein